MILYCREINEYLDVTYETIRRPRIPRNTMNPSRADWLILKIREGPPGEVRAGDYLTMLEQQREFDLQKLAEDSALVSTRRSTRVVADREETSGG